MTRVPYTPQAVALLRTHAARGAKTCAEMLGWPVNFTLSVARAHSIELMPVSAAPAQRKPCADGPVKQPREQPKEQPEIGMLLSPRQMQAFNMLLRAPDRTLSGAAIASRMGVESIGSVMATIGAKLAGTRYRLESRMGRGGFYRLVQASPRSQPTAPESAPATPSAAESAPVPATHGYPQGRP